MENHEIDLSREDKHRAEWLKSIGIENASPAEIRAELDRRAKMNAENTKYRAEIRYSNNVDLIGESGHLSSEAACMDWFRRQTNNGRRFWNGYFYIQNLATGNYKQINVCF